MTVKNGVPIEAALFFCVMSALSGLLVGFLLGAAADKAENDSLQSRIERLEAAEQ